MTPSDQPAPSPCRSRDAGQDWGALMAAAQKGDRVAYRRLLSELGPWLRRYFHHRLPPAMVDDAVQETLIAIHTKRDTYATDRPFKPWLAAVARHKWIDRLRIMGRSRTEELDETLSVPDHATAVASAISLGRLLETLRPAQAQVIRLVKLEGLSILDASERTGQSPALVKVNIHRGVQRMRDAVLGRSMVATTPLQSD